MYYGSNTTFLPFDPNRNPLWKERIPEFSCAMQETVDKDIFLHEAY